MYALYYLLQVIIHWLEGEKKKINQIQMKDWEATFIMMIRLLLQLPIRTTVLLSKHMMILIFFIIVVAATVDGAS